MMTDVQGYPVRRDRPAFAWGDEDREHSPEVSAFADMVEQLRLVQDRVTAARPPESVVAEVTSLFEKASALLEPWAAAERDQLAGHLVELPGRGQAMFPALRVDEFSAQHVRGRVTFRRQYLGGNGAVHGGAIPLMFDEILGRLANSGGRSVSRTAFLHVNFRKITPVGSELRIEGRIDREEGRKRFLSGTIYDEGGVVTADAEGLFVALNPGQP